jgi:alginate O-acetyltransferase complex protein AlgI
MTEMAIVVAVVLLTWAVAWQLENVRIRQGLLLIACWVFYATWGLPFLAVLVASSLVNFGVGVLIRRSLRLSYLWLGIALNVALLGSFKYVPALVALVDAAAGEGLARWLVMPIGISFWTFVAIAFLIDSYLEEDDTDPSLLEFCLIMAFWPTVLSGPVVRVRQLLPQLRERRGFTAADTSIGATFILQGAFMKLYVAQLLAVGWTSGAGVTAGFDQVRAGWSALDVWLLGAAYGLQLYFDFAGYSLIAIGIARLFGIRLPDNFRRPFLSLTPAEFWTRWHMSLSFWIRDYVFRPLVLVRREQWWSYLSLVVAMALFGMWHGAKWTFVVWGIYQGLVLVAHRVGQQLKPVALSRLPESVRHTSAWAATCLLMAAGFVLFRANTLSQAGVMLQSLLSPRAYLSSALPGSFAVLVVGIAVAYAGAIYTEGQIARWRRAYRTLMAGEARGDLAPAPMGAVIAGGVSEFLAARLWWWLGPAVASLLIFVAVALWTASRQVAMTPFIYTLF